MILLCVYYNTAKRLCQDTESKKNTPRTLAHGVLKEFYLSYSNEENDYVKSYVNTKKNYPDAFILDEENNVYLFSENEEAIKTFFQYSYQDALNFFVKNDIEFATVYVKLKTLLTVVDYIGIENY